MGAMSVEDRGTGESRPRRKRADSKVHVNPALSQNTHYKLQRLALECSSLERKVTKTELAAFIIETALNTSTFIDFLQSHHRVPKERRLIPVVIDGQARFP